MCQGLNHWTLLSVSEDEERNRETRYTKQISTSQYEICYFTNQWARTNLALDLDLDSVCMNIFTNFELWKHVITPCLWLFSPKLTIVSYSIAYSFFLLPHWTVRFLKKIKTRRIYHFRNKIDQLPISRDQVTGGQRSIGGPFGITWAILIAYFVKVMSPNISKIICSCSLVVHL